MGAHRRGPRRSKQRAQQASDAAGMPAANDVPPPARETGTQESASLTPGLDEVIAAIQSLYADELKPFGRILRKRIAEIADAETTEETNIEVCGRKKLADVDIKHLRSVCEACDSITLEQEEGGDWSAVLTDCPATFVDVYSPMDAYPEHVWAEAKEYFETLNPDTAQLPGGRYSCAQVLMSRGLPFLSNYSLGQVCHIIQLAISQKKILGYFNGAVVPYAQSQSMVKEHCAVFQRPCAGQAGPAPPMPLATWEMARSCLRDILESAAKGDEPGTVPLSNVKRLFRSRFNVELSETMLGHSKLSELLQDPRFADMCTIHLQGHGYTVVQKRRLVGESEAAIPIALADILSPYCGASATGPGNADPHFSVLEPKRVEFCPNEPLCTEDVDASMMLVPPTPSPVPMHVRPMSSPKGATPFIEFCPDEPLCTEDVDASMMLMPPTPSPVPMHVRPMSSPKGATTPVASRWPASALSPSKLCKDGCVGSMVQNTFIHEALPPPSPLPGARMRSRSLPKDIGSQRSEWEAICHALGYLPRPVLGPCDATESTADSASAPDSARQPAPQSPTLSSSHELRERSASPSTPKRGKASLPDLGGEETPRARVQFCPGEPLALEDAGVFVDGTPRCQPPFTTPKGRSPGLRFFATPVRKWANLSPSTTKWPSLSPFSPSKDADLGRFIHNTFIHARPEPPTPAPKCVRRSQSLPKDMGSRRSELESTCTEFGRPQRTPGGKSDFETRLREPAQSPAFVPPSPALTASPLYYGYSARTPRSPAHRVIRLADLL